MNIYQLLIFWLLVAQAVRSNLTDWRHHRRQARSLIYQNGGVVKFVGGVTLPITLDKNFNWRQLNWLMNFQYQFNEPQTPIYWWNLFGGRDLKGPIALQPKKPAEEDTEVVDQAQLFIFQMAESYLQEQGQNGKACVERLICENAQVDEHKGLYAELLYRLLKPHKSLHERYRDAYNLGTHGVNCLSAYPEARYCLLDDYLLVYESGISQSFIYNH